MFLLFLFSFTSVLQTIKYILIFLVVLGVIVGIHEAGHFFFARRAKILCREYAIGMGPKLWGFRKGETFYNLRALPIGGFCAIAGEEVEDDPLKDLEEVKLEFNENNEVIGFYLDVNNDKINHKTYKIVSYDIYDPEQTGNLYIEVVSDEGEELTTRFVVNSQAMVYQKKNAMQIAPYNRTLLSKNKRQRAMVMFGGPLMNFVLALFMFLIVGLFSMYPNYKSSVIKEVSEGTNAYEVLKDGDEVKSMRTLSIEKKDISSWTDLQEFMSLYESKYVNEKLIIEVLRDGSLVECEVTPFIGINSLGIGSGYDYTETNEAKIVVYQESYIQKITDNRGLKENDVIVKIVTKDYPSGVVNPTWTQVREVMDKYEGRYEDKEDDYVTLTVKRLKEGSTDEYETVYEALTEKKTDVFTAIDALNEMTHVEIPYPLKGLKERETVDVKVLPYSDYILENQTSIGGGVVPSTSVTIGISPTVKFSFFKSIGYAFTRTFESVVAVFKTLKLLFSGAVSIRNLSGPIGIYSITKQASQYGVLYVFSLVGLLSVNIGLLNLLPIPALDGGRLVFVAYEAITKKKPNPKVETVLITVTFILLLGLMIFVGFEDIMRLFK